jgi:hypothetical protein
MPRHKSQESIKKSSPYKRLRNANPFILFSETFSRLHRETRQINRRDAIKLASFEWVNMTDLQKNSWYKQAWYRNNQITYLEGITYDDPFIIENINQFKVNKKEDEDLYLRTSMELIKQEMLEKEKEEDLILKAFNEKFENLSIKR